MVQTLPFHLSARLVVLVLPIDDPTAVHRVADMHDTLLRRLRVAPAGFGVDRMFQPAPFQNSARVVKELLDVVAYPTATQAVADVHFTSSSELEAPAGLGTVCTAQEVPFHASANAPLVVVDVVAKPTASHAVADTQETPYKALAVAPVGFGVD
jgi:hypothetical protein